MYEDKLYFQEYLKEKEMGYYTPSSIEETTVLKK